MAQRQLGGEPATEREPDDVRPLDSQLVHHVDRVEDEILHVLDLVEAFRCSESGMDRHEHASAGGQPVVDRHPYIEARTVQVEERRSRSPFPELDALAADLERYFLFHHPHTSS